MSFLVSARKYRPIQFKDVVGQQTIVTTLKNAIKNDKLAQSFLFCGPRGVGKTTTARILAKMINCQTPSGDYEPCNTCAACVAFNQSASFNIFELDAASNNSVDDIRSLIEQVRFAPQVGKFKIYIIDEVHMLSQAAFNAFLKTLEEPPSYAIFILATTEKHKIIPTILSRCQIFDFSRIKVSDMVAHLQSICQDQQITAEEDALHIIAQKADGGLRDALSMFDRISSFSDGRITYQNALDTLSILDYDYYFKLTNALLAQDTPDILLLLDEILQKGFEGDGLIEGIAEHFRNLLVCKEPATLPLLEVSENLKPRYAQQAANASTSFLLTALNIANQADTQYKTSRNKRLLTELTLLKICYANSVLSINSLPPDARAAIVVKANTYKSSGLDMGMVGEEEKKKYNPIENNTPPSDSTENKNKIPPANGEEKDTGKTAKNEDSIAQKKSFIEKLEQLKNADVANNNDAFSPSNSNPNTAATDNSSAAEPVWEYKQNPSVQPADIRLDVEALKGIWKKFCPQVPQMSARAVLEKSDIALLADKQQILLTLSSDVHDEIVKNYATQFLDYLTHVHGISGYTLVRNIDKSKQNEPPPKSMNFMPADQFKEMAQKNAHLLELRKRLDLEII